MCINYTICLDGFIRVVQLNNDCLLEEKKTPNKNVTPHNSTAAPPHHYMTRTEDPKCHHESDKLAKLQTQTRISIIILH